MKVPTPLLSGGNIQRCYFSSKDDTHYIPLEPFEYNNWVGCACPDVSHGLTFEQMEQERAVKKI